MTVQLRLAALMERQRMVQDSGKKLSAYKLARAVAKVARGRVSESTIYRLVEAKGEVDSIRADTLEVLAEVFGCDVGDLFERDPKSRRART